MSESAPAMLEHVSLRVRLVYRSTMDASGPCACVSDIPGWELVGLVPAEEPDRGRPGRGEVRDRFVSEPAVLTLDRDEAEGYYLNLTSPEPSFFALIRLPDVASATAAQAPAGIPQAEAVTASYCEAARWMDGGMVVVRAPLPQPLCAWIAQFAEHHYQVAGPKKRGKYRPSFLSRREFGAETAAAREAGSAAAAALAGRRSDDPRTESGG